LIGVVESLLMMLMYM